MSFSVSSKDPQASVAQNTPQSGRDKAVALLNKLAAGNAPGAQTNTNQVAAVNPNSVSPEELGAVRTKEAQVTESKAESTAEAKAESSQETNSETQSEATQESKQPLSAQYAQLARKEKAIRTQVNELKAKEAELAKREEALSAKDAHTQSNTISKERLKEDLIGALAEAGVSYDEVTQAFLNQPSQQDSQLIAEMKAIKAEMKALKAEAEGTKKTISDRDQQSYQQALKQIEREAEKLVYSSSDFDLVKETGNIKEIVKLIEKTYTDEGYVMTVEDAAKAIEDELLDEISKYARLDKISKKLQSSSQTAPAKKTLESAVKENQQQSQSAKTLSNSMSTAKPMTARERAMAAFENKLNKS